MKRRILLAGLGLVLSAVFASGTAGYINGTSNLSGATPVTVVASPSSGKQRQIMSLVVHNKDSASRTIQAKYLKTAGSVSFRFAKVTIPSDGWAQLISQSIVLAATDETITVETDATAATTEPAVHFSGFEVP